MSVEIELRLQEAEDSGRSAPIWTGYRASWDNGDRTDDGSVHLHDAPITSLRDDPLYPGAVTIAEISPVLPDFWSHVRPDDELLMYEGNHLVGRGRVITSSN